MSCICLSSYASESSLVQVFRENRCIPPFVYRSIFFYRLFASRNSNSSRRERETMEGVSYINHQKNFVSSVFALLFRSQWLRADVRKLLSSVLLSSIAQPLAAVKTCACAVHNMFETRLICSSTHIICAGALLRLIFHRM